MSDIKFSEAAAISTWVGQLVLLAAICLLLGCSGGEAITKAGGTVKYDGKLLKTGTIEFYPVNGGRSANAVIQSDGSFTISYRKPGDGLPPGEYKVAVVSVKEKGRKDVAESEPEEGAGYDQEDIYQPESKTINVVPPVYNNIMTTPIRQTVVDDGTVQFLEIEIPKQ